MNTNWKNFERIVAAIHMAMNKGSIVSWSKKIKGRQFDVVIHSEQGLYKYLTLVECKDYSSPVPVKEVEAFATKSRRAKADKAVMVSSSGYQRGAKKVAKGEKIELYTLNSEHVYPEGLKAEKTFQTIRAYKVGFTKTTRRKLYLTDKYNMIEYLMNNVQIVTPDGVLHPKDITEKRARSLLAIATDTPQVHTEPLPKGTQLIIPYEEDSPIAITDMFFSFVKETIGMVGLTPNNEVFDPAMWIYEKYTLTNLLTGEEKTFSSKEVEIGFDVKYRPNTFYRNYNMGMAYFCESVRKEVRSGKEVELATLILVESYQMGQLFQATLVQESVYSTKNLEITDKKEIQRLQKMYQRYKSNIKTAPPRRF